MGMAILLAEGLLAAVIYININIETPCWRKLFATREFCCMVPALVATFHLGFCEIAQRLFLGCFFQLLNLVALWSCFALKILHYPSETIPCLCNSQLIYYTWVYSFLYLFPRYEIGGVMFFEDICSKIQPLCFQQVICQPKWSSSFSFTQEDTKFVSSSLRKGKLY